MLIAHVRRRSALSGIPDRPVELVGPPTLPPNLLRTPDHGPPLVTDTSSSSTVPCFSLPGVPPQMIAEELAMQAAMIADLQRYLSDGGPRTVELEAAPRMEGWSPVPSAGGVIVAGTILRHPRLGSNRFGHTSQIVALARDRTWARSLNRLWSLGTPFDTTKAGRA